MIDMNPENNYAIRVAEKANLPKYNINMLLSLKYISYYKGQPQPLEKSFLLHLFVDFWLNVGYAQM